MLRVMYISILIENFMIRYVCERLWSILACFFHLKLVIINKIVFWWHFTVLIHTYGNCHKLPYLSKQRPSHYFIPIIVDPASICFLLPTPLKESLSCLLSLPPATVLVRASLGCSLLLRCVVAGLSFHRGAFLATITSHKHFVFRILTNQCLNVRWSWRSYIYLLEGCYGTPVNRSFLEPQCVPCHLLILWFMFDLFHLT